MWAKNSTLTTSVSANAPQIEPTALPRPPKKFTPPSTTAAIEVST